uniref:Uncharacterized protein n=1 Tax=Plectus sambesii TaxID=2011161 RepID=A0A914UWA0_9BILA
MLCQMTDAILGGDYNPPAPVEAVYGQSTAGYNPPAFSPSPTTGSAYRPAPPPTVTLSQEIQYKEQLVNSGPVDTQSEPVTVADSTSNSDSATTSAADYAQSPAPTTSGLPSETQTSSGNGGYTETQDVTSSTISNGGASFETQAAIQFTEQTLGPPAFNYQGGWTSEGIVKPPPGASTPPERPPYRHYRRRDQPVEPDAEIEDMRNPLTHW